MISLKFPDGSARDFEPGVTGRDVAESISKSLAKKAVAMEIDGQVRDLYEPIKTDSAIRIITRDDPEALALIRHDAAHVMAEAVQELYPGTQVTIGPVIENGFYYDFARDEPFTPEDLPKIEAKMHEIIKRDLPFSYEVMERNAAKKMFRDMGEGYKVELIDAIPEGDDIKIYSQREWFDLCTLTPQPAPGHARSREEGGNVPTWRLRKTQRPCPCAQGPPAVEISCNSSIGHQRARLPITNFDHDFRK